MPGINVNQKKLALAAMRWRKRIHKGRQETGITEVLRCVLDVRRAVWMAKTGFVTEKPTSFSGRKSESVLLRTKRPSWISSS